MNVIIRNFLDRIIQISSLFVDRLHLNIDYCNDCTFFIFVYLNPQMLIAFSKVIISNVNAQKK